MKKTIQIFRLMAACTALFFMTGVSAQTLAATKNAQIEKLQPVEPNDRQPTTTPATVDEPVYLLREFMKVEPGMEADYLKVEAVWKKVHERRVAEGKIIGWTLFRRVFYGATAPADYMTVTRFKSGKDLEEAQTLNWDYITKGMSQADLAIANNTGKTRKMSSSMLDVMLNSAVSGSKTRFVKMTQVLAAAGNGAELEKMETMMKPVFEEACKMGSISAWRFGRHLYPIRAGSANYYRVISTSTMDEMIKQDTGNYLETAFKKVNPTKDWADMTKSFRNIITIMDMDLWELVDETK